MIVGNITTSAGITVDWISSKLYWTQYDSNSSSINVAELDGSNCSVLIQGDMNRPKDIVVHPFKRYVRSMYTFVKVLHAEYLPRRMCAHAWPRLCCYDAQFRVQNGLRCVKNVNLWAISVCLSVVMVTIMTIW